MFLGGIGRQKYLLCGLFAVMILSSFFVFVPITNAAGQQGAWSNTGVAGHSATGTDVTNPGANLVAAVGGFGEVGDAVLKAVATVLSYLVNFLLKAISLCSHVLIGVASYNNFVNETSIVNAWKITRDIANMFFVVVFLVIAIGTILGLGQYNYKKALPRLLLMAVLINFSRTIAGVVIDFGQVIMLTFVNAFHDTAAGNFINGLGLNKVWEPNAAAGGDLSKFPNLIFSYILAALVVIVAFVVMVVMLVVLVFRIVMLWMLLAISPLAFFAWAVPGKTFSGYFDKWWKMFVGNVISGPILAFFLWLALTVMATSDATTNEIIANTGMTVGGENTEAMLALGSTTLGTEPVFLRYLISIGMLVGGLQMTQELKVIGSGFAGDALKWMEKTGKSLSKRGAMAPLRAVDDRFRVREGLWTAASKIPLMKRYALAQKGKVASGRSALIEKKKEGLGALGWEDKLKISQGRAITPEDRARKIAAQKDLLHNKADQFKMKDDLTKQFKKKGLGDDEAKAAAERQVKSTMQDTLEGYNKYGEMRKDKSITGDAYAMKLERPDWIKGDDNKEKFVKGMLKDDLMKMSPLAMGDKVVEKAANGRAASELSEFEYANYLNRNYGKDGLSDELTQEILQQKSGEEVERLLRRVSDKIQKSFENIPLPKFEEMVKGGQVSPERIRVDQLKEPGYAQAVARFGSEKLIEGIGRDNLKMEAYGQGLSASRRVNLDVAAKRGLDSEGKKYSSEVLAVSKEMLGVGVGVKQSFNADIKGNFMVTTDGTSPDRASFGEAISTNPSLVLNIKPEELTGDVRRIVSDNMQDSAVLRNLVTHAKTADQKETFDMILGDVYKNVSKRTDAKAVELRNHLEKGVTFRKRIAAFRKGKPAGGGEEETAGEEDVAKEKKTEEDDDEEDEI